MKLTVTSDPDSAKDIILRKITSLNYKNINYQSNLDGLLEKIPEISKKELQKFADKNFDSFLENGFVFSETSGTTGNPLPTPRNSIDYKWNTLNQITAYKRHLQSGQDRIAVLHPSILSPFIEASISALQLLNIGYLRIYPIPNVCNYERIISVLERYKVTAIMSTPSLVYKLLYECKKITGNYPTYLKKILLTGEFISSHNLNNMRRMLGDHSKVVPFVYGSSEAASLMYGIEDGGYVGFESDFIFEVVPYSDATEITINEEQYAYSGCLLVSWLRSGLLPIIRYNTNDFVKVRKTNDQFVFYPQGRIIDYPISLKNRIELDKILYSDNDNVIYNYTLRANNSLSKVEITVITDNTEKKLSEFCKNKISVLFPKSKIDIRYNEGEFLNFSPKPKYDIYLKFND